MRKALLFLFIFYFGFLGCGVKGKPMPQEEPPVLGRGEPNFIKATERIKLDPTKPQLNRPKPKPPVDDWDEE